MDEFWCCWNYFKGVIAHCHVSEDSQSIYRITSHQFLHGESSLFARSRVRGKILMDSAVPAWLSIYTTLVCCKNLHGEAGGGVLGIEEIDTWLADMLMCNKVNISFIQDIQNLSRTVKRVKSQHLSTTNRHIKSYVYWRLYSLR